MHTIEDVAWLESVGISSDTAPDPLRDVTPDNGFAHWSLACGLMAMAPTTTMALLPVAVLLALAALLLGGLGLHAADDLDGRGRRRSIVGITLAALPIGIAVLTVLVSALVMIAT